MKTARRGQFVTYKAGHLTIRAIVRNVHRDGTSTVEARFVLNRDGIPISGYLGYRYRLANSLLRAAQ